ncbi:SDR family NAD(P)-dependent oxidoreductase [Saccharopolyspora halophila]|uniref:SDR family NAD(P)-dependent oxidoreductase n=1 Tax=Saccharopolyspora halophila TaxID=405551 RepID=UPI0031E2A5B1
MPVPSRPTGACSAHWRRSLFNLNVFGLINVTRAVLPVMRAQGSGKLVHIGSRAGYEGEPGVSMYNASKFAVAGISEALSQEMAPFGVQSMVVEPGAFRHRLPRPDLAVAAGEPHQRLRRHPRAHHPGLGRRGQSHPVRRPSQGRGPDLRDHLPGRTAHAPPPWSGRHRAATSQDRATARRPGTLAEEVRCHRPRRMNAREPRRR